MKTNDEWVEIKLKADRIKLIKNKNLKEKVKETPYLNLRITNIELETGETETLITNIPEELSLKKELKNYTA